MCLWKTLSQECLHGEIKHFILSKSIYFSGQIKSIDLCLVLSHDDDHCGEKNVTIELFYGPKNSNSCKTEINDDLSHGKDNLIWTDVELGSCDKVEFNMDMEELKFKISAKNNKSCKDPWVSEDER